MYIFLIISPQFSNQKHLDLWPSKLEFGCQHTPGNGRHAPNIESLRKSDKY